MRIAGALSLAAAAGLSALVFFANAGSEASNDAMDVAAYPITHFKIGSDETRFGPFEFVGGLELTSRNRNFGSLSAFRFLKSGEDFIGVADAGFWAFGRVVRDDGGRPVGFADFHLEAMLGRTGNATDEKWDVDAEGLAVKEGIATVGFERDHRIAQFRIDPEGMGPAFRELNYLVPSWELRRNKGFETVAYSPSASPHHGGLVVITERSIDKEGNIFAAIIEGPNKGVFTVKRNADFDITDGAFLPDGDLLLLERKFSMASGVAMRLRRIDGETLAKGRIADGPVLLEADMGYQIDNMEGLDVWQREDGATMVSIVSDDNNSILQRNLYLEFRLVE